MGPRITVSKRENTRPNLHIPPIGPLAPPAPNIVAQGGADERPEFEVGDMVSYFGYRGNIHCVQQAEIGNRYQYGVTLVQDHHLDVREKNVNALGSTLVAFGDNLTLIESVSNIREAMETSSEGTTSSATESSSEQSSPNPVNVAIRDPSAESVDAPAEQVPSSAKVLTPAIIKATKSPVEIKKASSSCKRARWEGTKEPEPQRRLGRRRGAPMPGCRHQGKFEAIERQANATVKADKGRE